MKAIILAAGYATRLYPLTLTRAKPLLEVAGKPMINYVLDNLAFVEGIDEVCVVTNAKFAQQFERWAAGYQQAEPKIRLTIVNDGSTDDSNKLGAIGDLHLVLRTKAIQDELIVVAGDNLFSQNLQPFGKFCRTRNSPVVGVYDVGTLEQARKYNSLQLDPDGRILEFVEKAPQPVSTLSAIALYYYPPPVIPLIHQYVAEGNNPDQPGRLVQWLYPRVPFYTWQVPGLWFDIGSKETLEEANQLFARK